MFVHSSEYDNIRQTQFSDQGVLDKEQLKCDYFGYIKHTREIYWKLHGHSTREQKGKWVGPTRSQAHIFEVIEIAISSGDSSSFTFSKEEL